MSSLNPTAPKQTTSFFPVKKTPSFHSAKKTHAFASKAFNFAKDHENIIIFTTAVSFSALVASTLATSILFVMLSSVSYFAIKNTVLLGKKTAMLHKLKKEHSSLEKALLPCVKAKNTQALIELCKYLDPKAKVRAEAIKEAAKTDPEIARMLLDTTNFKQYFHELDGPKVLTEFAKHDHFGLFSDLAKQVQDKEEVYTLELFEEIGQNGKQQFLDAITKTDPLSKVQLESMIKGSIRSKDPTFLKELLSQYHINGIVFNGQFIPDRDRLNSEQFSWFMLSCEQGNVQSFNTLFDFFSGKGIELTRDQAKMLAKTCIENDQPEVLDVVLDKNRYENYGKLLKFATSQGSIGSVNVLLEKNINFRHINRQEQTYLIEAITQNKIDIAIAIARKDNRSINIECLGESALEYAFRSALNSNTDIDKHLELLDIIHKKGAYVRESHLVDMLFIQDEITEKDFKLWEFLADNVNISVDHLISSDIDKAKLNQLFVYLVKYNRKDEVCRFVNHTFIKMLIVTNRENEHEIEDVPHIVDEQIKQLKKIGTTPFFNKLVNKQSKHLKDTFYKWQKELNRAVYEGQLYETLDKILEIKDDSLKNHLLIYMCLKYRNQNKKMKALEVLVNLPANLRLNEYTKLFLSTYTFEEGEKIKETFEQWNRFKIKERANEITKDALKDFGNLDTNISFQYSSSHLEGYETESEGDIMI